ncbi:MAG: SRPBCC family protein [Kordiimonas sp.]
MNKVFEIELNISAEQAWVAVGEKFGETGQWTSLLDSSYLEGQLAPGGYRVCMQKNKKLTERITQFDPENMKLEYELIDGRPPIVQSAGNSWSIMSLGSKCCLVSMRPEISMKWWAVLLTPLLWLGLNTSLPKVLEEFKHWAETGTVHPRKKAMAKSKRKFS